MKLGTAIGVPLLMVLAVACEDSQAPTEQTREIEGQQTVSPASQATPTAQPTATAQVRETPAGFVEVGPEAVWDPLAEEAKLYECTIAVGQTECATATMERLGASPQAIGFFRTTGWFLTDFQEMGKVDLGSIVDPWRANSLGDFALLNGTPAVVIVEGQWGGFDVAIQRDPAYDTLLTSFPDLLLWPSDEVFEAFSASPEPREGFIFYPEGTERSSFIFQFTLNDGCHACVTGYMARVALDFAPDGTYLGRTLLGLCASAVWPLAAVAESVPDCPAPAAAAPTEALRPVPP